MQLFKKAKKNSPLPSGSQKKTKDKLSIDFKQQGRKVAKLVERFQIAIIIIFAIGILEATTLRMLQYTDPAVDELAVQEKLNKLKPVRIDPKTVEKIKSLSDSNVSTSSNIQSNRKNPFAE